MYEWYIDNTKWEIEQRNGVLFPLFDVPDEDKDGTG